MASYVVSIDYPTAPTGGVLSGKNIVAVNYELTVGAKAAVAALMSGYVARPDGSVPAGYAFLSDGAGGGSYAAVSTGGSGYDTGAWT